LTTGSAAGAESARAAKAAGTTRANRSADAAGQLDIAATRAASSRRIESCGTAGSRAAGLPALSGSQLFLGFGLHIRFERSGRFDDGRVENPPRERE
jgi:hypothetical protein